MAQNRRRENPNRNQSRPAQGNTARRRSRSNASGRRVYDQAQDARRASSQRRGSPQGYQEQTIDFANGSVRYEQPRRADNSIQFPRQGRQMSGSAGQNGADRLPERPGPCPRPEWESQHPPGERSLQRREKRPQRADAPHGGQPPQPQPPGEQKEAEADPRGHPAAQDHPPSDRLCPAALRHCGGRLPHGHHAVQDQLHSGADGGRHAGGRGGRLRQRADLAGAGRPHRREHLQL